jgi:sec-independent protein translocase protein TatB
MFDIGFWELVILFGLGLIILGPERLPKVAMQVGNWAGQARRMARTLSSQMRDELDLNKPYTPPTYSRPGMDDLKPGSADDSVEEENTIHPEADDRDHTDAGAER